MTKTACLMVTASAILMACEGGVMQNLTIDRGIDSKELTQLQAGIWVDPNGCQHWIIDDGVEGYMSQRLTQDGKPVCDGSLMRGVVAGDFKAGSPIADIF